MSMFEIRVENNLLYPVSSISHANIDHTLDEWIRFLSYVSPDDESFLNKLNGKSLEQLTTDEIKKYLKIKEQKTMADLFIKYKNKACTRKEHDSVYKYMKNSLEDFMKSKLTENELNESCKTLAVFRKKEILELEDYIKVSNKLLKDKGEFYMVHRPERLVDIISHMRQYKIEPKEIRFVCSHINESPKLVLIKGVKNAKPFLKFKEDLYIYNKDGNYTEEIYKIYNKKLNRK